MSKRSAAHQDSVEFQRALVCRDMALASLEDAVGSHLHELGKELSCPVWCEEAVIMLRTQLNDKVRGRVVTEWSCIHGVAAFASFPHQSRSSTASTTFAGEHWDV